MREQAEQFAIGRVVPGTKYRTRALIGTGGMGSVYEVEHVELGKLFVLKALRAQLVERTDLAARMKNEWRALGRLQHPNIVTVTDAGTTDDGVPFFVMERLEGDTLATRLRREKRLSVPLALRVAAGVLKALAAAHAINVVHRDIKPQNVFLPAAGGVKLLDFGVAKLQDRDRQAHVVTARGVAIGTPKYMSPEQAEGKVVDGRADIYAVGLVIFEMIAGRGPFAHRRDANELVLAHMTEAPARLDTECDAPAEVADLVQRWLSKSPADRPVDAAHAVIELQHLLERYTFDGAGEGSTSAPTVGADYAAVTHAEPSPAAGRKAKSAPNQLAARAGSAADAGSVQRTLALGTSSRVSESSSEQVAAVAGGAPQPSSPSTQLLTGTMGDGDAPTTRTVLPPAAVESPSPKVAPRASRLTPRTGTPPPVERRRLGPERSWLKLLGVAVAAGVVSFTVAVVTRGPVGGAAEAPPPAQGRGSDTEAAAARQVTLQPALAARVEGGPDPAPSNSPPGGAAVEGSAFGSVEAPASAQVAGSALLLPPPVQGAGAAVQAGPAPSALPATQVKQPSRATEAPRKSLSRPSARTQTRGMPDSGL